MKKAVLCVILAAVCFYQQAHAQSLTWDIKFLRGNERESVSILRTIRMENEETFLITIKPDSNCYCYVILEDTSRDISVIHDRPLSKGMEVNIGPYEILDPAGKDTFFVIMSLEREQRLEGLIKAYNDNPRIAQNSENLRKEIARLQDVVSALGQPVSSFIPGGGTSRGSTQEYVTRFEKKNMYVNPIIIQH